MRSRWTGLALTLLGLTACGTTVHVSGPLVTGDGLTDVPVSTPQRPSSVLPEGSSAPGSSRSDGSGEGIGRPVDANGDGAGPATVPSAGPLATDLFPRVLKVGIQYSSNAQATLGAIGSDSSSDAPDVKDIVQAVIDHINAHGGAGGRKVAAVYNDVDATASPQAESEQACTSWTQDNHVSVAIPSSAVEDNNALRVCMGKAGVPTMYGNVFSTTLASSFAQSPLWFEDIASSLEGYARSYVAGLAEQGFFTGGKVGVVYHEAPAFATAMRTALLPALKQAGVSDPATYAANISGASDLAAGGSQMSSAVLSFRSKGVDRVLFFEPWAGYFVFLNAAQSQGYHPRYGLSSQEAPEVAISLGLAPTAQLTGAKLVSWWPLADVRDYSRYVGPRLPLCLSIFKKAGVPLASDRTGLGTQLNFCENLLLVADAYRSAPARLTGLDFTRGLEALGARAQLATRPAASFGTTKHWGASTYYHGSFDASCGCFVLQPGAHPMKP